MHSKTYAWIPTESPSTIMKINIVKEINFYL